MKLGLLIASALVAVAGAGVANAAVVQDFAPGVFGAQAGETLIADFDSSFGGVTLSNAGFYTGFHDGEAAPPAGDATSYLAVLGGGSASFSLLPGVSHVSFDVGSVDSFNSVVLTLFGSGDEVVLTGSDINDAVANGDQHSSLTNGRLTLFGNAGERFTSLKLLSSANSFEVDNLAVSGAVPEPATWAMMIVGFGAVGATLRRRRTAVTFAA